MNVTVALILKLLKDNNISDATLCKQCGLTHSSVYDWKTGRAKPSAEAIAKIAKFFNITSDYLLDIEKPSNEELTPSQIIINDILKLLKALTEEELKSAKIIIEQFVNKK